MGRLRRPLAHALRLPSPRTEPGYRTSGATCRPVAGVAGLRRCGADSCGQRQCKRSAKLPVGLDPAGPGARRQPQLCWRFAPRAGGCPRGIRGIRSRRGGDTPDCGHPRLCARHADARAREDTVGASLLTYQGVQNFAVYAAAKAHVLRQGEALHREFKRDGVMVTTLCPGMSDTGFAAAAQ